MGVTGAINNGKLYVKTVGKLLFCLNAATGQLIWENLDAGYSGSQIMYYKNKLYYMAFGKIYCVDSNDGKVLYSFESPNASGTDHPGTFVHDGGLVIDPATNLMYFADSYYATCIKVPE
jgi:outer membrane protein assembly factor BamB